MAFDSKENVLAYLRRNICKLRVADFEVLAPRYFDHTLSFLLTELKGHKLTYTSKNLALFIEESVKESEWETRQIITVAASLELEWIATRCKYWQWQTHHLKFNNTSGNDFRDSLRRAIRSEKQDAEIIVKKSDGLLWIAVLFKTLDKVGLYEAPIHFVMSTDLVYLFTRKKLPDFLLGAVLKASTCRKIDVVKLSGRNVPTLLQLLRAREDVDMLARPEFTGGVAHVTDEGTDYTMKKDYEEYMKQCINTDLDIVQYTVQCTEQWMGDDIPELRLLEVKSSIVFKGNVANVLAQLPSVNICRPPFPAFIRDFGVLGKSTVTISSKRKSKNFEDSQRDCSNTP